MDIKEEFILGDTALQHWYYRAKAAALRACVADEPIHKIVDVGAGSGLFSKYLLTTTKASEALCIDISYPRERDELICGKPVRFRKAAMSVDADLVLMMDVLEHVEDDVALLKDYVNLVPPGTRFVITVPAFSFLWSEHDIFLEHKRRYTLLSIEQVVKAAGINIEWSSYIYGIVFPIAAAQRLLSKSLQNDRHEPRSHLRKHSSLTNFILHKLCVLDLLFLRINKVAGLTALCLARKS